MAYRLHKLQKSNKKEEDYRRFISDILDHLPFPVMVKDIRDNFRYVYWNNECELQSVGIDRHKAVGFTDFDIYGPERGKYYRSIDEALIREGKKDYRAEESYTTEDGIIHDTLVMKSIISWGEEKMWLLVVRWEITQLKSYARELTAAKEELEKVIKKQQLSLRNIDFGLIYIDKDYRVQWEETTKIKKIFNDKREYIPGEICYKTTMFRDTPCPQCAFKECLERKEIVKHTIRLDDQVDCEISATPVYNDANDEMIGGLLRFENITEKVKTAQMLQEAKEKAEESNRLKSAFLANMSHEIRTPLNAIIGFSDMICQTDDLEDKEEYMKIISANNSLLLQLINDILDLSKIEAGTMDYVITFTDINKLLEGIHKQMLQKNQLPDVLIEFEKQEEECFIETDGRRLSQILINFMNNAMKFTTKGYIRMGYSMSENKDEIYFYVKDTGKGIPEDKLQSVFERFVKLDSFAKGTGLGLAICRVIVERMKGTIGVESKEGEGSCFWFKIPVKVTTDEVGKGN